MSAITELIEVVEHLVATHSTWNMSLSQEEAKLKLVAAKAEHLASQVAPVADAVDQVVNEVAKENTDA